MDRQRPATQRPYAHVQQHRGASRRDGLTPDTTQSYSVAAWVKLNDLNGFQSIISTDATATSGARSGSSYAPTAAPDGA